MDVQRSLGRIRTQMGGMERMMRILRAEVEGHIAAIAPAELDSYCDIETGLGQLFAEARPIAPVSVEPYKHFAKGVWMGLDTENGDCGATVSMKALHDGMGGNGRGVARLSVNPVFPMAVKPGWVTLETAVSLEALKRAAGLRIDTVSFFDIAAGNSAQIPRSVTLNLRLHRQGGKVTDHLNYRIPVSTMPFEHSARIGPAAMEELSLGDVTEALLILELPLAGTYTLKLDHFAVLALDEG
ncbi:hypothetical protein SAMN06297129_2325 [Pseudooceanicola antarcticus]|uniref:Uncharacterized protein n=2 Tax=Pseudooceanicola antarcticus TaxID=1247613 RepID=A0A285IWS3_9RHOB|nr:hypothetical protein [Pseudooceanicola antarcticus]SNY52500.1 hypothetical protein SAMN06297129_2325 [Pseudooceanicola antarcticus]